MKVSGKYRGVFLNGESYSNVWWKFEGWESPGSRTECTFLFFILPIKFVLFPKYVIFVLKVKLQIYAFLMKFLDSLDVLAQALKKVVAGCWNKLKEFFFLRLYPKDRPKSWITKVKKWHNNFRRKFICGFNYLWKEWRKDFGRNFFFLKIIFLNFSKNYSFQKKYFSFFFKF